MPNVYKLKTDQKLRLASFQQRSSDPTEVELVFNRTPTESELAGLESMLRQTVGETELLSAIAETNVQATGHRVPKCKCENLHFDSTGGLWVCSSCGRDADR
ncbi:hypothetical protein [Sulfitobacter mediterraneus]|uniref:hypothetical protein n=1 Tax=Sulfitobacter mediterraneus TaxID=83219 RepID=UPI0021A44D59|nr:hypothetical protein [Sulfitobacter mediterraneus]UWR13399.1 hypothetical protein K3753_19125 [Sulfitobacter mediterraneus]